MKAIKKREGVMKKETRAQVMKRIGKLMASQAKGQLVCRTCGEAGCCQLAHDNLHDPSRPTQYEKDGKVYTRGGKA